MFIVLYRWELKPEQVKEFKEGWSEIVHRNIEKYGALGSRLHKASDGSWYSYSQWNNRSCWQSAFNLDDSNQTARQKMVNAIIKAYEPVTMAPSLNHLLSDEMVIPAFG